MRFLKFLFLVLALPALGQQTNRLPINRGILQSDADGNHHLWTNLNGVVVGNNSIDGAGFHGDPISGSFGIANMFDARSDGTVQAAGSASFGSINLAASSNRLQVVNALGQYVLQVTTNGSQYFGTNGLAWFNEPGIEFHVPYLSIGQTQFLGSIIVNGSGQAILQGTSSGIQFGPSSQYSIDNLGNVNASNVISGTGGQFIGNAAGLTNFNLATGTNVLRAFITPFDVGAVGDGVTDDANALKKWLFIACSSNWIAFLPPAPGGSYACSTTLLITNGMNHVNILGAGGAMFNSDGSTVSPSCIKFTTQNDGLRITNSQSNVRIDGIRLTNSAAYVFSTHGLWFDGNGTDNDNSSVRNCSVQGFGRGLMLSSVADSAVENCSFGVNGIGVEIAGGTYANPPVINQVRITACQLSYNYTNQVHMTNAGQYVLIQSCDISPQAGASGPAVLMERAGYLSMSEMHVEPYSGKPCIVATDNGAGAGGTILNLQNLSCSLDGTSPGPNTYSVIATNATVTLLNAGLSDLSDSTFPILMSGAMSIRSDRAIKARWIQSSTVFTNTIPGMMFLVSNSGTLANNALENQLTMLYNDLDPANSYINSYLMIGARLADQFGNVGVQPIDLFQYAKDTATSGNGIQSTNGFKSGNTTAGTFSVNSAGALSATSIADTGLTASSLASTDAGKNLSSIANGGANTFLQGTTPPTYTQVALGSAVSGQLPLANGGTAANLANPGANNLLGWDNTDSAMKFLTLGSGLTYTHSTHTLSSSSGGAGSDSTAWHQSGDNSGGIWGNTNAVSMFMRMQQNGVGGATVIDFETIGNNEAVNITMGDSNSLGSVNFNTVILGGEHNSTGNGPTDGTIVGGRFNSINGNGNQAFIGGGGSNQANGAYSVALGQAAIAANNNSFVFNGLGSGPVLTTSGGGGDNGKILFGGTGFEFTNNAFGSAKYFGINPAYSTNLMPVANAPDFNYPVQFFSTNNVVKFQAPTNVDSSGKFYQTCIIFVTNTTPATPRAILPPANCLTNGFPGSGTPFVTNLTRCTFEQYGQKWTNMDWKSIF